MWCLLSRSEPTWTWPRPRPPLLGPVLGGWAPCLRSAWVSCGRRWWTRPTPHRRNRCFPPREVGCHCWNSANPLVSSSRFRHVSLALPAPRPRGASEEGWERSGVRSSRRSRHGRRKILIQPLSTSTGFVEQSSTCYCPPPSCVAGSNEVK